jgi:hypothetical protein
LESLFGPKYHAFAVTNGEIRVRLLAASPAVTFIASVLAGLVPSRLARRIDLASAMKAE